MTDNDLAVLRVILHDGPIDYSALSAHPAISYLAWSPVRESELLGGVLERLAHRGFIEALNGWRITHRGKDALCVGLGKIVPHDQGSET